jgi:hypothetical protein
VANENPTGFPKEFTDANAPEGTIEAIRMLMPVLLAGDQPFLSTLRRQYEQATIASIQLTGAGFYAHFIVPPDLPLTEPLRYSGGDAVLTIDNSPLGGGCVLYIQDAHLTTLEVFVYADEGWDEVSHLTRIADVMPPMPRTSE